jgi:hypothetical protein
MKYPLIVLFFFFSPIISAQELKKGLLMPDDGFDVCCIYIPKTGLKIYTHPKGVSIGKLTLVSNDSNNEGYEAFITVKGQMSEFEYANLEMVGYEIMAIIYTDRKDGFVKTKNGYWLSESELTSKGLKLTSWMQYLINRKGVLGWYANDPGLNLRKRPSTDSQKIVTLTGDLWQITSVNKQKGLWCKVKVKKYKKHPCSGEEDLIIQEITGWVKLLSDNQTPNVWSYLKGC